MSVATAHKMTFEEFTRLNAGERYELVDGKLETLMAPMPLHGWSNGRIFRYLDEYLEEYDPQGFSGVDVDIPTLPFHGRRPDYIYYDAEATRRWVDLEKNRVSGVPTLAVEIVSTGDERRDEVTKRREYAEAGIAHYWILDPVRGTVLTLRLESGRYAEVNRFSGEDTLTSPLFPGLSLPLRKLFR